MKKIQTIFAVAFILIGSAWAQNTEEFERLGQTSMTFLDIEVGARAVGMGGASTCIDNDVNSIFWNPAGLAKVQGLGFSVNQTNWIADMNQFAVVAAYGHNTIGTFGVSLLVMDNGTFERTIPSQDFQLHPDGYYIEGDYTVQQWAAGIAYSRRLSDRFALGGQVKYVYENLGNTDIAVPSLDPTSGEFKYVTQEDQKNREGTIALDFGTLYYFGYKDLRVGMNLRNFSRPVTYAYDSFYLPVCLTFSVGMNVLSPFIHLEEHDLQFSIMMANPYDGGERVHLGGEYVYNNLVALRAGYRSNTSVGSFSAGFGFMSKNFINLNLTLNYAYSSTDDVFGPIHRFSLGFGL
jgi:hypothetical protein